MFTDVLSRADAFVAVIAGTATVTVQPAPGVGQRLRLVGSHITVNRGAPAAGVDCTLRYITSGTVLQRAQALSPAGTSYAEMELAGPGYQGPDNDGIELAAASGAAGGSAFAVIYFYFDDKT